MAMTGEMCEKYLRKKRKSQNTFKNRILIPRQRYEHF